MKRNYGLNSYEFYGQDTWRIKPNLTLTYGLRWSFFPPPWETNGLQTSPTFGLGTQFATNVKNMQQGLGYTSEPPMSFTLGGPANNGPGFYSFEKTDWSPRVSIAYSPRFGGGLLKRIFGENDKTVIRAGFSRVYDRAGFALLNSFDQIGSARLTHDVAKSLLHVKSDGSRGPAADHQHQYDSHSQQPATWVLSSSARRHADLSSSIPPTGADWRLSTDARD